MKPVCPVEGASLAAVRNEEQWVGLIDIMDQCEWNDWRRLKLIWRTSLSWKMPSSVKRKKRLWLQLNVKFSFNFVCFGWRLKTTLLQYISWNLAKKVKTLQKVVDARVWIELSQNVPPPVILDLGWSELSVWIPLVKKGGGGGAFRYCDTNDGRWRFFFSYQPVCFRMSSPIYLHNLWLQWKFCLHIYLEDLETK